MKLLAAGMLGGANCPFLGPIGQKTNLQTFYTADASISELPEDKPAMPIGGDGIGGMVF